ncbi:MAG TPA: amino acid ABC transporter permease [Stellaceae bacterium]|nr:amino acid ABC transporter permease [Stellaceae bacterium]
MTREPAAFLAAALRWLRARLFNNLFNGLLTLLVLYLLARTVPGLVEWAVVKASLFAPDDRVCAAAGGACWSFIRDWLRFIVFGRYPYAEQWRPAVALLIFVALLLLSFSHRLPARALALSWVGGIAVVLLLMHGGIFGMPVVETELWNGVVLALLLAAGGLGAGFPLALLLALGRRSTLPAVRWLSVAYIEVARGVPFIAWLFLGLIVMPLFLPPDVSIAKLWRAEIVFTLFIAAYLAEVVRGGLQAMPRGQYEAADALGLGYVQRMRLVILPQALAITIPAQVNTFIGAFKDTTLISIIGLFDPLQDTNTALNDPAWRLAYIEGYVFIAAFYFVFCYFMSLYSRRLERRLAPGRA